jgi:hypothetical protein
VINVSNETKYVACATYLAIGYFPETLEDLLGSVLILCHADHKPNELFKAHSGIL